jgi:hypothetical protein
VTSAEEASARLALPSSGGQASPQANRQMSSPCTAARERPLSLGWKTISGRSAVEPCDDAIALSIKGRQSLARAEPITEAGGLLPRELNGGLVFAV